MPRSIAFRVRDASSRIAIEAALGRRGAMVAANPALLSIGEELLFPDGDAGFHFVDDMSAGVEGGIAMGGGNADHHGDITDLQEPGPVNACGVQKTEAHQCLIHNTVAFLLGELGVCFVFEP